MGMRNVFPDYDDLELRNVAESTLRSLLAKGWIALHHRIAFKPITTPLEIDQVEAALADQKNWEPPDVGSIEICYTSTEEGERAAGYHAYKPPGKGIVDETH